MMGWLQPPLAVGLGVTEPPPMAKKGVVGRTTPKHATGVAEPPHNFSKKLVGFSF
jgi:hypothetical protein